MIVGASDDLSGSLVNGLEILWLMHPLATGLIFSVIFLTPWLHIRDVTIATLLLASIGAGAATFAFAADIAYVVVAQIRVRQLSEGQFKVLFGPATWMMLPTSSLFTLPSELLHVIVVLSTTNAPISTLAAISETCKTLHALVYNPEDHSLWREIFANFFDDPRPARTFSKILHGEQAEFRWPEELRQRMRAAQVVRLSTRLASSPSEITALAPCMEDTLRTLLDIIKTAMPLVNTKISIGTTSHEGQDISPAFPPLVLLLAAELCGFSSLNGCDYLSRSARWLESLLRNGFPRVLTRRLLADSSILPIGHEDDVQSGPEAAAMIKNKIWQASEEAKLFYQLVAYTGFIPVLEDKQEHSPSKPAAPSANYNPFVNPTAEMPHTESPPCSTAEQEQLDSARRKARTIVYDLKFLKPHKLWGPFMSSLSGDDLDGDRASAVSLMAMADEIDDSDSDDPDFEPDEADSDMDTDDDDDDDDNTGRGWEPPTNGHNHTLEMQDEDEEEMEDNNLEADDDTGTLPLVDLLTFDPQLHPPRQPPLSHHLVPDWKWLSAARIVVEANIRDMLGRSPAVDVPPHHFPQDDQVLLEVKNALKRMEGLRMGGAPDFWTGDWADKVAAAQHRASFDDSISLDKKGKFQAADDAQEEGWDWAGVAGTYRRCTCWLDYRDLLSKLLQFAPQRFADEHTQEAFRIHSMELKVTHYSWPPPDESIKVRLPIIHVEGAVQVTGEEARSRFTKGHVSMIREGAVRWHLKVFHSSSESGPEWSTEGVQIGAVGSALGVIGLWTGAEHERTDPLGPFWAWKVL
ncbi:hypothetical protein HWV62_13425 [Athelia sp. TMB]|nr:hypothetical protein HWV62_13425 [Athelia sp. TMB]